MNPMWYATEDLRRRDTGRSRTSRLRAISRFAAISCALPMALFAFSRAGWLWQIFCGRFYIGCSTTILISYDPNRSREWSVWGVRERQRNYYGVQNWFDARLPALVTEWPMDCHGLNMTKTGEIGLTIPFWLLAVICGTITAGISCLSRLVSRIRTTGRTAQANLLASSRPLSAQRTTPRTFRRS